MDPRLLRLYSEELTHLREVGAEFAQEFPKVASRLGMDGVEVADPYVERLLEGFAFLAARVQLKLEAEQPRLVAHLLESLYPNFLAPVPSMMVLRFAADTADPNLVRGFTVPRGSGVVAQVARGQETHCEFRTASPVTLWPFELVTVQYLSFVPDMPVSRLPQAAAMRGAVRLRLRTGGGIPFSALAIDRLRVYIAATEETGYALHELILGSALGTWIGGAAPGNAWRDAASVAPCGYGEDEALLPVSLRAFSGHRLIQEAAAMPQRLMFFDLCDLRARLAQVDAEEVDIVVALGRGQPALEAMVDRSSLALYCTPAINLFGKRLDRVALGPGVWEHHLVADRMRPNDFEIHHVTGAVGFGIGSSEARDFRPLYETSVGQDTQGAGYYTIRREPRVLSQRERTKGARSAYVGDEVYLSLVDAHYGGYREELSQLAVSAEVTNRDLPLLLPQAGTPTSTGDLWKLGSPGPVASVEALRGPTRPLSRLRGGTQDWRLVSQLALNHVALHGADAAEAARMLRTMLHLYGPPDDVAWARQVDGLRALHVRPVVRRLPFPGPLCFGTGSVIDAEVDELAFQGASAYLFAGVLEAYFARHAAINSFTQFGLRSLQRGLVRQWPPRVGTKETL